MIKVFIGGSRKIVRLNKSIKERIDNIINKNFMVLIGDANGIDKAVQKYLFEKNYHNVVVYFTGNLCRNNVGSWRTENIETTRNKKDFNFYVLKDLAMVKRADYGFMIWDAKSKGTLNNIINLLKGNKNILVYFAPENEFYTLSSYSNLEKLLAKSDEKSLKLFEKTFKISEILKKEQQEFQPV